MSSWHPDDMTLMNYVAGSSSAPEALAIATHLSFCHECSVHVKNLNNVGGALLENIKPASVNDAEFDSLMESLLPHDQAIPCRNNIGEDLPSAANGSNEQKIPTNFSVENIHTAQKRSNAGKSKKKFGNPLENYLPASLEELAWHHQTKEISKFDLTGLLGTKGYQVALQKIKAGARVPTHTHKGVEYTVILRGGFSDELGVYHVGDFISRDATHYHSPTALQNEDCICLTVLSAPLAFTGWYRILNPFMGWK